MTRIFISHSHADSEIASLFVDFLRAALKLELKDILCSSVPGYQLELGNSISEQLKKDLNQTTALIALITKDSLRSTWVLFELGSSWGMGKLVVPILAPGLNYEDLPGPLKQYQAVRIDDKYPSHRLTEVINKLAQTLKIQQNIDADRLDKQDKFIEKIREWQSQLLDPTRILQQQEIKALRNKLKGTEQAYNKLIEETEKIYQQQKEAIEQSYQTQISELQQSYQTQIERLEQFYQTQIERLEQLNAQLQEQQKSSPKSLVTKEVELKSEKGVDYTKLRELLAAGKWQEADKETAKVMCQAVGKDKGGHLTGKELESFPCEDFQIINQLWLNYSDGKFGFSVQKDIYESLGGTKEYHEEVWSNFCERIGWRKGGQWLNYSELIFNLGKAPIAHLPSPVKIIGSGWAWDLDTVRAGMEMFPFLAQRLLICKT